MQKNTPGAYLGRRQQLETSKLEYVAPLVALELRCSKWEKQLISGFPPAQRDVYSHYTEMS